MQPLPFSRLITPGFGRLDGRRRLGLSVSGLVRRAGLVPVTVALALIAGGGLALGQNGAEGEGSASPNQPSDAAGADGDSPAGEPKRGAQGPGPFYPVSSFDLDYLRLHPGLPATDRLLQTQVTLARTEAGYVPGEQGGETVKVELSEIDALSDSDQPVSLSRAALQQILETLRDNLLSRDLRGVYVAPDPRDINAQGEDLRPDDQTTLRLLLTASIVTEVRTLGIGGRVVNEPDIPDPLGRLGWAIFDNRIPEDDRVNHPAHREIRRDSPIKGAGEDREQGDLLRGRALDEYLYRKSRHPGRRVDAALSPADEASGVTLDYQVRENKPWAMYFQMNNTGTANTDRLRQQFGVFDHQLTGNDDTFRLEYLTASFEDTNAINTYYEAPLAHYDRLRWAVNANYSEYTASDVGAFGDTFTGESWEAGGELIANVYQRGRFFLDVYGGAKYTDIKVDSTLPGDTAGDQGFLLPRVGTRYEMNSRWYTNTGELGVEWHSGAFTDADQAELNDLGRFGVDEQWARLHWRASSSVFLEPILNPEGWRDPSTPRTSTLAHEVAGSVRGQTAFGARLIPQMQQTAGGLYTVRGYPESLVAGDSVIIGSLEYRFHVPQVLGVEPQPQEVFGGPFRFAPQYPYGVADWDLVPRVFVDAAHVSSNSGGGFSGAEDETLLSAGVGLDVSVRRNVRFSIDWGWALEEARGFDRGNERVHFNFVLLY